jgi:hypothetical protein
LFLPATALLILQCEVSRCRTRESGFHLPKAEALLDKFLEPNETVLLYNIP